MIVLETGQTLRADADAASMLTSTIFGMELDTSTQVETYKVLDQRQIAATVATIYTVPASTCTFIKSILVVNNDSVARTFQYFVGGTAAANAITPNFSILPGGSAVYEDGKGWQFYNSTGQLLTAYGPFNTPINFAPNGYLAESIPRNLCPEVNTTLLTTGQLWLQAIFLYAGMVVTNISFWSATTALGTGTHQLFGLYDSSRNLLASSADVTSAAWAANSEKKLAMTAAYTVPSTGLYYCGVSVAATTMPTFKGGTARTGGQLGSAALQLGGISSSSGITTTLPNPAGALTANPTVSAWCAVS